MKSKEIAKLYGVDNRAFSDWMQQSPYGYQIGFLGDVIVDRDEDIEEIVKAFKDFQEKEQKRIDREQAALKQAEEKKQATLAKMLITSGFSFEGYTITKYSGYISGDDAVQISRGTVGIFSNATDVGDSLMKSLAIVRRNALAKLKEAAYALGCNAVIGVDFDYLTLDPETANSNGGTIYLPYVFGVTANGNAVVIKKKALQPES